MTTRASNQCSCIFQQSGDIISITNSMAKLLNKSELISNNIYQLLQNTSNCNLSIIHVVKTRIIAKSSVIDVILKFKCSSMQSLLSFFPLEYLDVGEEPLIKCIAREVALPVNCKILFQSPKLSQSSIAEIKSKLDSGEIKLSDKERAIMFMLALGIVQDKIATILGCSRGYVATVISRDLCPKFGIAGSSTVRLAQVAVSIANFYQEIPKIFDGICQAVVL